MNAKRDYPLRDSKGRVLDWWGSNHDRRGPRLFTLYCDNLPVGNVEKLGDGKYYGFIMSRTILKPHDDLETAKEWVLQGYLQRGKQHAI